MPRRPSGRRVAADGRCAPRRHSGIRFSGRAPQQGQAMAAAAQCATAAAAASSMRRPVRKRSSANGAAIGCGSPAAIVCGEDVARAGRRLEPAGAPAAIDVEPRHRRLPDDRRAVGRDVDDAAPVAQHAQARECREQLADRLQRVLGDVQAAAPGCRRCTRRCRRRSPARPCPTG